MKKVLQKLTENGFEAYLVGGCVRDKLLGRPVHDWDVATSAMPEDVIRLFDKTTNIGERFGTVRVVLEDLSSFAVLAQAGSERTEQGGLCPTVAKNIGIEVTTFRADGEYLDSRHPESVQFVTSLHEDLRRRDFTVNAMAETISGEIIDPFGGLSDIEARLIRCVGDPATRFCEDALRIFRALRFSGELGFEIEPETLQAIDLCADRAQLIAADRVRAELKKTLKSPNPQIARKILSLHDGVRESLSDKERRRIDAILDGNQRVTLAVSGHDLIAQGIAPGPQLGELLEKMRKHVEEHPEDNTRQRLLDKL